MNRFYFRCDADPRFQYPGIFISDLQEFDVKWFISFWIRWILKFIEYFGTDTDLIVRDTDPRIQTRLRIRIKMSRIRNTGIFF